MFKKISCALCAITLLVAQTATAETISITQWATVADISPVSGAVTGSSEWFLVELPGEIVKKSANPSLSDIRLIDSTNTEIPYVIVRQGDTMAVAEGKVTPEGKPAKILENTLDRGPRGQDRIMVLEIPLEGKVYNGINLQTSPNSDNFRKVVRIAVSDVQLGATSPAWREIESKPVIYNYSDRQGLYVEKTKFNFIPATSRYIRLRFEQDPALAASGVQFTNNVVVESARVVYESDTTNQGVAIGNYLTGQWLAESDITQSAGVQSITENASTKSTEIVYKTDNVFGFVGANKITIKVDKDETNFKRQVTVLAGVQDGLDITWKSIGAGQIYRINSPVFQGESTGIVFPPTSANYFKVIIQNNNDTALKFDSIAAVDIQKTAVLFKKSDKDLSGIKLVTGNKAAIAPTYEIQKTVSYFETIKPEKVLVQNIKDNPLYNNITPEIPFGQKYKWLLNTALVVFVLLIALLGWKWRVKPEVANPAQNGINNSNNEN